SCPRPRLDSGGAVRADAERADRFKDVRDAARAWRRAGAIDEPTLAAVEAAYPDDRRRLGPALRTLTFVFTTIGVIALAGFLVVGVHWNERDFGGFFLVYGLLLAGATEWQLVSGRRSQAGTEAATGFVGLGSILGGTLMLLDQAGLHGRTFDTLAWTCAFGLL